MMEYWDKKNLDQIQIRGLRVYAYHGVKETEKERVSRLNWISHCGRMSVYLGTAIVLKIPLIIPRWPKKRWLFFGLKKTI